MALDFRYSPDTQENFVAGAHMRSSRQELTPEQIAKLQARVVGLVEYFGSIATSGQMIDDASMQDLNARYDLLKSRAN